MHVKFQMTDDILIASVFGELDHHSAAAVRDEIDQTTEAFQCRHLILDFEKVTFMDSSGIGVVLGRYNKVTRKDGRIFLAGCSEFVEKILYMAGVFSLVDRQKNVQDALCLLKGQRQMQMEVSASGE